MGHGPLCLLPRLGRLLRDLSPDTLIVEPLTGKAAQSIGHKASIVALEGSVRSSKTWTTLIEWLEYCRRGPAGPLLITGRTERTVITNIVLPLQQMLGAKRVKLNRGLGLVTILGRECMIVGADNETAVTKIQGRTLAGALVDETSTLPESYFDMLYSRLSIEGAQVFLTSNPEAPAHWLMAHWLSRARLWIDRDGNEHVRELGDPNDPDGVIDLIRISFKLEDNPNLPPAYVARIKAAYSGLWYRRYILGEWCIAEGAVYDCWDPDKHVVKAADLPPIQRLLATGIDYGTTHPTRGYLLGVSAEATPRLVFIDEWRPGKMTDSGYSKDYRNWIGSRAPEWVAVDPAAASFKLQLFTDGLSNVMDANNSVISGIRTVASLLSSGRLIVSDACVELIAHIPGYSWDPKATARGEDAPIKQDDDECDAARYAVASTRALWGTLVPITVALDEEAA
ncbi:MAG: phage terminase large subunit [Phycisphaerales bacterium]